ncbi:zinc finger protein 862-like [Strongylocentrotus purpuratus]|uniref:Uncharacterized protein n=1 Tax=Strongylocentrotus purpuratus TaxID=7668 RepID=A0A7M7N125_STRPU|nr:zinc finger protein 862-like [Strongylocentrotus purpuratus]
MLKRVQRSKFISIISDGTTDASVTEDEIVFLRHACNGSVYTEFVAVVGVVTADAKSITDAILHSLAERLELDTASISRKLVGFGSDGAAVMLGKRGGVVSHLRELSPALQAVHCTAHRLELAFKDAVKNVALCKTVNLLLLNLYLFYKNSSKNRSSLKQAAEAEGDPKLFPTRVGGTRWLPHLQRALGNFLRGYRAITTQLQQLQAQPGVSVDARAKSKGFLKQMKRKDVVLFAHFMLDVVTVLSKVSLTAQRSESTVPEVARSIDMALTTLKKYRSK